MASVDGKLAHPAKNTDENAMATAMTNLILCIFCSPCDGYFRLTQRTLALLSRKSASVPVARLMQANRTRREQKGLPWLFSGRSGNASLIIIWLASRCREAVG
jgi:hypothetical protein